MTAPGKSRSGGMAMTEILDTAMSYAHAGLSVIPVRPDGSKAAAVPWADFQKRIAGDDELRQFFSNGSGIAIIAGAVSGYLEILDFETGAPFHEWLSLIEQHDLQLASTLVIIGTPTGGHHVPYRCPTGIAGNQKLAMRMDADKPKVLIETRGEGGYVVTVGSPAACHPTKRRYSLIQGDLVPGSGEHSIPTISAEQRSLLIDAARSFNEVRKEAHSDLKSEQSRGNQRPGDVLAERMKWPEILEPHGWKMASGGRGEERLWRRPGKESGFSATTNYRGSDLLYVFSTNAAPFQHEESYTKFAAFALLAHAGDFKAAARAIADRYGLAARKPASATDQVAANETPSFNLTDAGNGELIAHFYDDYFRHDHARRRDLYFAGHRWSQDATGELTRLAKDAARHRYALASAITDINERKRAAAWAIQSESRSRIEAALAMARCEEPISDSGEDWNNRPMLLAVANGVVDLETGSLRDGTREDRLTLHTPIVFDSSARCIQFERFFVDILGRIPELVDFLHLAIGYSLTGLTLEQVLFILCGSGANGKSVLLSMMRAVLGEYAYNMPFSTVELKDRASIPNDVAALADRRLVTASETNDGVRFNEARIKALTGCDPLTARFLHSEFFTFKPVAKFWLSANHKPRVSDDSFGFWRRVRLIPFTQQFRENADPHLEAKLLGELPGILNFFIRGCREWQRRGLKPPDCVTTATETYRQESDPLGQFIAERCTVAEGCSANATELYRAYKSWAEVQGFRDREVLSVTAFGRRLGDRFVGGRTRQGKFYSGIKIDV